MSASVASSIASPKASEKRRAVPAVWGLEGRVDCDGCVDCDSSVDCDGSALLA